jgi:maltooligosyltrehalose trehalohydrolase
MLPSRENMMLRYVGRPRKFGPSIVDLGVLFRLWAPKLAAVSLALEGDTLIPMAQIADGWHELLCANAKVGTLYQFALPDGSRVPDPASRFQPSDVHGPSEVVASYFLWTDDDWQGVPWEETVIYELHVGSFTTEGTFTAAAERLDYLSDLGVTAIEIMPVADFPGRWNWGYDGVLLFAPDSTYGRPEELKAFVNAAHTKGIQVFLDVVYNHFGPDGNYLEAYSPIFTDRHKTPWGAAVNYDAPGSELVREFVIENAIYWVDEFHLDGLRLDAVHAIKDDSKVHVLDEIAFRVREAVPDRTIHLMLENEENEVSPLERGPQGAPRYYTAQWNDDVHHVLHVAATGEKSGYYADYLGDTEKLGRALAQGFAFQGEMMKCRGLARGEPSAHLPPTAFVSFLQNHDQVGNRAFGDRLTSIASARAVRALASIYLLLPQIPMIFMGEEFGASQPFPFFCDFEAELATAVRDGRRAEFAKFPEFHDPAKREQIPDPTSAKTFLSAKLDWGAASEGVHGDWLAFYRNLLQIRHQEIMPRLSGIHAGGYTALGKAAVDVRWPAENGTRLRLAANLAPDDVSLADLPAGRCLWLCGGCDQKSLHSWSVLWTLEEAGTTIRN